MSKFGLKENLPCLRVSIDIYVPEPSQKKTMVIMIGIKNQERKSYRLVFKFRISLRKGGPMQKSRDSELEEQ